jgi:hypothetical protein
MDESGRFESTTYVGMSACFGLAHDWAAFDDRWRKALADNLAPYLHMREFAHRRGPFKGWEEERRRALMAACLDAVAQSALALSGVVIRCGDFRRLPSEIQNGFKNPYYLCFQDCLSFAEIGAYVKGHTEPVNLVYSELDEFRTQFRGLFNIRKRTSYDAKHFGSLEFQNMRTVPGLQLADLVAYELTHFYYSKDTRPEASVREPLRRLCENGPARRSGTFRFVPYWRMALLTSNNRRAAYIVNEVMWRDLAVWYEVLREMFLEPLATPELLVQIAGRSQHDLNALRTMRAARQSDQRGAREQDRSET